MRYLDLLALTVEQRGWRCFTPYRLEDLRVSVPLLWIYGAGESGGVGIVVIARATAGDSWAYYEAHRGWSGYLAVWGGGRSVPVEAG